MCHWGPLVTNKTGTILFYIHARWHHCIFASQGIVNQKGLQAIDSAAAETQAAVDAGRWTEATNKWSYTEMVVMMYGNNVNFYNVLAENDIYKLKKDGNKTNLSFMSPAVRQYHAFIFIMLKRPQPSSTVY